MVTPTHDLIAASQALDPAGRALLNLWLHRGLDDAAIARLSGGSPRDVAQRRRRVVDALAAKVGAPPDEVARALDRIAAGEPEESERERSEEAPPPSDQSRSKPQVEPEPQRERRARDRPSRLLPLLGLLLGIVIVVAVLVALLSPGDGGGNASSPAGTATPTRTATPATTRTSSRASAALRPVPGGPRGVSGAITVAGRRLDLRVRGLPGPASAYEVWLFNSIADARSLGRLDRGSFPLPRDRRRYAFLDVSREPGGNPNHSGRSVLRAPAPR